MDLASRTPDAIHLEVGEPHVNTPSHIINAACEAAHRGFTKYSPNAGLYSLREIIARKLRAVNGIDAVPEQVMVTPGAVFALAAALYAVADPEDDVLIPDPGWPNYASILHLLGARAIRYPLGRTDKFKPDFERLATLVTQKTKALIINTPANPTGSVFPQATMSAILEFARHHDLYVISDEVYENYVFEGEHFSAGAFDSDGRVITVFGVSKTYSMTGWHLGYTHASLSITSTMTKLAEPFVSCPSTLSQKAAEAALDGSQEDALQLRAMYAANRETVIAELEPHGLLASRPDGAFYALVDLSHVSDDSNIISRQLLEQERVATSPGTTFGTNYTGLVRISYAADPSTLKEGCRRIARFGSRHARKVATLEAQTKTPHGT